MRITRITAWKLDLPLREPYWLSGGRLKFETLDSTFVRIDTDEGVSGWGEGCPWGHTYLPAHGPGIRAALEILAPALIGLDPRSVDAFNRAMDVTLPGHNYAKSPLDIACWDILGKVTGLSLWQLFGASSAAPVPVNSSISTGTADQMCAAIASASENGYRWHSAKIGGTDAAADLARMEAISAALPPNETLTFDINRAWLPAVAIHVLNSTALRNRIEQPCQTIEQCAHVAGRVPQPIILDECLHTFQDHLNAYRMTACEGIKVKPNRVGGLTKARQIRDFGLSVGWQMHVEDTGGTALADTAAIHLAASTPQHNRLASWLCHYHLAVDPLPEQGARNEGGYATPPKMPGLGVQPDMAFLGQPCNIWE